MKKILTILFAFIFCFSAISCSCKKDEPIMLEDSQYVEGEGKIEYLSSFDLIKEKIDSKSNFAMFMYDVFCDGCHKFIPVLEKYVKEKGIVMYAVTVGVVSDADSALKKKLGDTPSVTIFKDGEIYKNIHGLGEDQGKYFETKEGFGEWFETYVILK